MHNLSLIDALTHCLVVIESVEERRRVPVTGAIQQQHKGTWAHKTEERDWRWWIELDACYREDERMR